MNQSDFPTIILAIAGGAVALGVAIALLVVAVKITGGIFSAIFWIIRHVVQFVVGIVRDVVRLVGSVIAAIVSVPMATCNFVLGRWSRAGAWGAALKREVMIAGYSIFSIVIRRPLQLLCLDGVLDGIERRLPQAAELETMSVMSRNAGRREGGRSDQAIFAGYDIEGTLRPGGSGAKLYIAAPTADKLRRTQGLPAKVVIKSFALEEGSSLPQIVRESRALDSARAMGLVLDHGLDEARFWYAMPYHAGENLTEATRLLHARSGPEGLVGSDLSEGVGYAADLVATLNRYHEGGLWHKDVKPDNIIVHGGRAHLVDLGLMTPLRSAMTLTTHGTEYFRDPEMVRQALRGVRVHQVDGAKFDVYGAGAVLYFMLENTFPAHGGLSSFAKRSPEALRWIVRRAMADYHQRYPTAQALLVDLDAVARAADPWSVRPVDLPSMRGADVEQAGQPSFRGAAWMPPPAPTPQAPPAGVAGWFGRGGAAVAAVRASMPGRPELKVTNWWTGAYASPDIAGRVRDAAIASKAARRVVSERKPRVRTRAPGSRIGALVGLAIPLTFVGVLIAIESAGTSTRSSQQTTASVEESIVQRSTPPAKLAAPVQGAKLLVVNDHPGRGSAEVDAIVNRIAAQWTERGFALVSDDTETAAKLELALGKLNSDGTGPQDDVEAALAAGGYWAALKVDAGEGEGPSKDRLRVATIGENAKKAIASATEKPVRKSKSSSKKSRTDGQATEIRPASLPSVPPPPEMPPPAAPASPAEPSRS